jgi:hypothetical protein
MAMGQAPEVSDMNDTFFLLNCMVDRERIKLNTFNLKEYGSKCKSVTNNFSPKILLFAINHLNLQTFSNAVNR